MSKLPSKLNNLRQINNMHGFSVLILFEITKDKLVTGMVSRFSFCLKLTPTFFLVDSVAARMRLPSYSPPCELKAYSSHVNNSLWWTLLSQCLVKWPPLQEVRISGCGCWSVFWSWAEQLQVLALPPNLGILLNGVIATTCINGSRFSIPFTLDIASDGE